MNSTTLISVTSFCESHAIEPKFIETLAQYEFVEIIEQEKEQFIEEECLATIEQMIRLHYDLNINMEGIDAIQHLLNQIHELQKEVVLLRNKLNP